MLKLSPKLGPLRATVPLYHIFSFFFTYGCPGSSLLHVGFLELWRAGFSLQWLLLLQSTGSRCTGFGSRGLGAARGIFLDQQLNPCISRQILNHRTTKEVLLSSFLISQLLFSLLLKKKNLFFRS